MGIDLIGKVVKVNSVDDLSFYYPEFHVKSYLSSFDVGSKIIYTGNLNKRAQNILESCEFIATQGLYQYDLTDRKVKIQFVYDKWNKEIPGNILTNVDLYDDDEFNYCCKVFWVSARWPYKPEEEGSIYELYRSSVQPVNEFLKQFIETCDSYPVGVVEQSFFTFMLRSKSVDEQNVSPVYKRLLKSFYNVSGSKFKKAMTQYLSSPIGNRELRFVDFIFALRS